MLSIQSSVAGMIFPELWQKLEPLDFSKIDSGQTFMKRLIAENGWSDAFANRAVLEYKRFIYLSVISEERLVPSDVVDQVWQLHLGYSRHYWGKFSNLLGRQIHHEAYFPEENELGGYVERYRYTLSLYRGEFDGELDRCIWPESAYRFSKLEDFVRIDVSRNMVMYRPTAALWRSVARFAGVAVFPLSIMGYAVSQSSGVATGDLMSSKWIIVAGIAVVIASLGCLVWRMEFKTNRVADPTPSPSLSKRIAKVVSKPAVGG